MFKFLSGTIINIEILEDSASTEVYSTSNFRCCHFIFVDERPVEQKIRLDH